MCAYDHLKVRCVCAGMLCMCMCKHVYAMPMHMCTPVDGSQMITSVVFLDYFLLFFF